MIEGIVSNVAGVVTASPAITSFLAGVASCCCFGAGFPFLPTLLPSLAAAASWCAFLDAYASSLFFLVLGSVLAEFALFYILRPKRFMNDSEYNGEYSFASWTNVFLSALIPNPVVDVSAFVGARRDIPPQLFLNALLFGKTGRLLLTTYLLKHFDLVGALSGYWQSFFGAAKTADSSLLTPATLQLTFLVVGATLHAVQRYRNKYHEEEWELVDDESDKE